MRVKSRKPLAAKVKNSSLLSRPAGHDQAKRAGAAGGSPRQKPGRALPASVMICARTTPAERDAHNVERRILRQRGQYHLCARRGRLPPGSTVLGARRSGAGTNVGSCAPNAVRCCRDDIGFVLPPSVTTVFGARWGDTRHDFRHLADRRGDQHEIGVDDSDQVGADAIDDAEFERLFGCLRRGRYRRSARPRPPPSAPVRRNRRSGRRRRRRSCRNSGDRTSSGAFSSASRKRRFRPRCRWSRAASRAGRSRRSGGR